MDFGYSIFAYLIFWGLLFVGVIAGIIIFIIRRFKKHSAGQNPSFQVAFSREDALSQLYFLLCVGFGGVTLLAINQELNSPFSFRSILLVTCVAGVIFGYKYKALYTAALSIFGLVAWWIAQSGEWVSKYSIKAAPILTGFILLTLIMYVVGHFHEQNPKWKRFSFVYLVFSIIFFSGIMFFLSTRGGLESFGQMLQGSSILASWEIMLMLIGFLVILIIFFILTIQKNLLHAPENLAIVLFTFFALVILAIPGRDLFSHSSMGYYDYWSSYNQDLSSLGTFWAVVFNVGVFLEMLGVILIGYLRKESWHVTLGVILLFILILVKYFDWFFKFLDKSLFFIGAGILMFGVGYLMERARKKVIASIAVPETPKL